MNQIRVGYSRVRRRVEQLLHGQNAPPVDLARICSGLGVEVRALELAPDISGILYREADRSIIVVNSAHSETRRRFTIAHELGHLALHRGREVHVDSGFRINLRDPKSATAADVEEIEANAFAANLLLPANWLLDELEEGSIDLEDQESVQCLAEKFEVSEHALLIEIGYPVWTMGSGWHAQMI